MTIDIKEASVVQDVRALLEDRTALHRQLTSQFLMALPTEKLQHAFSDPPEGTSSHAVLTAMREANDSLITIIIAALDESDGAKTPKRPTRFQHGHAFDDITDWLHMSLRTVDNWLALFIRRRFARPCGHHFAGRGRKAKLSGDQRQRLYALIEKGPLEAGFTSGRSGSLMSPAR